MSTSAWYSARAARLWEESSKTWHNKEKLWGLMRPSDFPWALEGGNEEGLIIQRVFKIGRHSSQSGYQMESCLFRKCNHSSQNVRTDQSQFIITCVKITVSDSWGVGCWWSSNNFFCLREQVFLENHDMFNPSSVHTTWLKSYVLWQNKHLYRILNHPPPTGLFFPNRALCHFM